jgi:hypothetical protein
MMHAFNISVWNKQMCMLIGSVDESTDIFSANWIKGIDIDVVD